MLSDGVHVSLGTFATKTEADRALMTATVDQVRGSWIDPRGGRVTFAEYTQTWLGERSTIRPRTRELYAAQLRLHLLPAFGATALAEISTSQIRGWHARIVAAKTPGPVTVAKCYRLLRTILNTAVDDGLLAKNPCVIKGAGIERSPERPTASIEQVYAIAAAIEPRYRMLVLLGTFTSLRFGELSALTRRRVDVEVGLLNVAEAISELSDGTRLVGDPKSSAGRRSVAIPAALLPELRDHLDRYAQPGAHGLVFLGPLGGPLRRSNWSTVWRRTVDPLGLTELRFHDLRHTGNTLAAATGASTKELMRRMGHSSTRAALLYQHATNEREFEIARRLNDMIEAAERCGEANPATSSTCGLPRQRASTAPSTWNDQSLPP